MAIGEFESHMTLGSHHLLLVIFYRDSATNDPIEELLGPRVLLGDAVRHPAPQRRDRSRPALAAKIPKSSGFRIQSHYLNITGAAIKAHVEVTFHLDDPKKETANAGVLFMVQPNIDIAPDSTADVTYDCHLPMDMNIMKATSHMHRHGTKFTSTIAGKAFYDTSIWDEPMPEVFAPPRSRAPEGDPVHIRLHLRQ